MSLLRLLARQLLQGPVTRPPPAVEADDLLQLADALKLETRFRLGRSLAIREVDAGSCNGCELELQALSGPVYDLESYGIRFVASPRHADVLLITGPVTANMAVALHRTFVATPGPKWVVAMGDCAHDGGCFAGSYAVLDGVRAVLPVDLDIPGCPPAPERVLAGLLALLKTVSDVCPAERS